MRLLVCGCRDWNNEKAIHDGLAWYYYGWKNPHKEFVIIIGGAPGADILAENWATKYGIKKEIYPANWQKHGKAAGPIRNQQMLDEGKPTHVLAFWDGRSPGTKDMIIKAVKADLDVYIVAKKDR